MVTANMMELLIRLKNNNIQTRFEIRGSRDSIIIRSINAENRVSFSLSYHESLMSKVYAGIQGTHLHKSKFNLDFLKRN